MLGLTKVVCIPDQVIGLFYGLYETNLTVLTLIELQALSVV